jgi:hypothetical protein
MCKYFDDFKIFPTSIVKEKQNPQDFTLLILKTKHYCYLQSKNDTVKLKVHDDSNQGFKKWIILKPVVGHNLPPLIKIGLMYLKLGKAAALPALPALPLITLHANATSQWFGPLCGAHIAAAMAAAAAELKEEASSVHP